MKQEGESVSVAKNPPPLGVGRGQHSSEYIPVPKSLNSKYSDIQFAYEEVFTNRNLCCVAIYGHHSSEYIPVPKPSSCSISRLLKSGSESSLLMLSVCGNVVGVGL